MAKQPQPSTADQNAAYARAEQAINEAGKNGAATLSLSGDDFKHLTTLPPDIANLTALTSLDLLDTQVSDIAPLAGLTALTRLTLISTQVSDIAPLAGLTALTRLDLIGTQVSDIAPLAGLTALTRLTLRGTQVSDIAPLAGLTALTSLFLIGTQVSDIAPLAGLTALTRLTLRGTQVSDIAPLAGLTALTSLDLGDMQVSDIAPLAGLTALTSLDLDGMQVSDIAPLAGLTALTRLDLRGTQVSDIAPLANLTALTSLTLWGTQVSDIAPLAGLTALTHLDLSRTQVSDIMPLAGLTALTHLDLDGMQVSDLSPLLKLTQLEKNPSKFGLSFENTAAAKADKRIADIAETTDAKDRAAALFAYLRDGQAEQQAQYNALLSTRLMRASIGDFHFDDLTRVMRMMPFEEDLRRLRDPGKLKQFIEQAEDLRDGMRTLSNAVSQSGGNMQGAGIAPYLEGIISELDRAKTSDTLRVGKIIEYGETLEDFSLDPATRAELGEPISKDLTRQVNALLELTRSHFADTFLRFAPLRDIEMDPDQTPTQALAQVEALLRSTRAAAQNDLIPLAPEDDEVFTHILRSIEKLIRAHGQATTERDRARYQREINFKLALFANSIGLYQIKAKNYGDKLGTGVDWLLRQLRRVKGLSELIELFTENLDKL